MYVSTNRVIEAQLVEHIIGDFFSSMLGNVSEFNFHVLVLLNNLYIYSRS